MLQTTYSATNLHLHLVPDHSCSGTPFLAGIRVFQRTVLCTPRTCCNENENERHIVLVRDLSDVDESLVQYRTVYLRVPHMNTEER
jgi:hypothetical protein